MPDSIGNRPAMPPGLTGRPDSPSGLGGTDSTKTVQGTSQTAASARTEAPPPAAAPSGSGTIILEPPMPMSVDQIIDEVTALSRKVTDKLTTVQKNDIQRRSTEITHKNNDRLKKFEDELAAQAKKRLAALEEVVDALEAEDLGLEESLARYREGVAHLEACRALLDEAEARLVELTQGADGRAVERPLQVGENGLEDAAEEE